MWKEWEYELWIRFDYGRDGIDGETDEEIGFFVVPMW